MKNYLLLLITLAFLPACTTISFVKDSKDLPFGNANSEWHSNVLFGFIETSDPVDMNDRCQGTDWVGIRTQFSFANWFVSGITASIYNPHKVLYFCESDVVYKKK